MVPHTLALSVALSAGRVSGSGDLQRSSWPTGRPPSSSAGGGLSFSKLCSPSIPETKTSFKTPTQQSLDRRPRVQTPSIDLISVMESLWEGWVLHGRVGAVLGVGKASLT